MRDSMGKSENEYQQYIQMEPSTDQRREGYISSNVSEQNNYHQISKQEVAIEEEEDDSSPKKHHNDSEMNIKDGTGSVETQMLN